MEVIEIKNWSLPEYERFIESKKNPIHRVEGNRIFTESFNGNGKESSFVLADHLWDYQKFIVKLALAKRRFAIFSDVGTGKTAIFLEWVRHISKHVYPKKTLIISQLHLIKQTLEEQMKFYHWSNISDINRDFKGDINAFLSVDNHKLSGVPVGIVNVDKFRTPYRLQDQIGAIVLDESGILKSDTGKIRTNLINSSKGIQFKLACTATPAPNDRQEYANHALFLEFIDNYKSFFTKFFYNTGKGNDFLLKPHAKKDFYKFLSMFSIFLKNPAHYGFNDNLAELKPPIVIWQKISLTKQQYEESLLAATGGQMNMFSTNFGGMVNRNKVSQIAKGFKYGNRNAN